VQGNAQYSFGDEGQNQYKRADASCLAVTSRTTPCEMLGGNADFERVVNKAKQHDVKLVVDSLARISSSRHHRKFKDLLLHYLDLDGRRRICYGTDGQSQQYEDTAMLNYRKVEAWDLLAGDVVEFISKYDIDGIHLDNGQAWPQIMELDLEEMFRADVDGEPAYSSEEIMNGEVVVRNENYGYWNSNAMENYANPFFVKLCR
jgi:starch synthase